MDWRLAGSWYALCLGGPLAVALAAVALHRLAVGDDATFHLEMSMVVLSAPFLVVGLFLGPLQEELGWRGYVLPRSHRSLGQRPGGPRARVSLGVLASPSVRHRPGGPGASAAPGLLDLGCGAFGAVCLVLDGHRRQLGRGLLLHSATNAVGVILLKDARSDFGPSIIATVLTVGLAAAAAYPLRHRGPGLATQERNDR